jgi:hypothetical protein
MVNTQYAVDCPGFGLRGVIEKLPAINNILFSSSESWVINQPSKLFKHTPTYYFIVYISCKGLL